MGTPLLLQPRMQISVIYKHVSANLRPDSLPVACLSTFHSRPFAIQDSCKYRRQQRRHAHSRRNVSYAVVSPSTAEVEEPSRSALSPPSDMSLGQSSAPLSILPLKNLLRSYLISTISSSPTLLSICLGALKVLARSRSPFLNPDHNPILHFLLKKTVYAQFCAGETATEVRETIARLKNMGYKGVMLCYAREVVMDRDAAKSLTKVHETGKDKILARKEIESWAQGTLATVQMAPAGDFVSVKFTGAGRQALQHLTLRKAPAPRLEETITEICEVAKARGVRLLFDAEQDAVQAGIDNWTVKYMRRYNREGRAMVYGTYQAYKKAAPEVLAKHMEYARNEGFVLGVKLVRGAYLGSDPRNLFWDTAEETHSCYDGIASSFMRQSYNEILKSTSASAKGFPAVNLILAGHNGNSVYKAQELRNSQVISGQPKIDLAYGQLMGMAENISCGLVHAGQVARTMRREDVADLPAAYQYVVWGSVGDCSQYLVRRAEENKDAVTRTMDARRALGQELLRRLGLVRLPPKI